MTTRQKIAIIGTGITGMVVAHLLHPHHDIMVFEKEPRIGGHTHTVKLSDGANVDSGFIVYNKWTYPTLIRLFEHLKIPTEPSDMGFSVCTENARVMYAGQGFDTIFAQRKNILSPRFWGMLLDLVRFYRSGKKWVRKHPESTLTLGEYLDTFDYGRAFIDDHLLPMAASIWSTPDRDILTFPASSFLKFCDNHGLLNLVNRPQWRTVSGGAQTYVERITKPFAHLIKRDEAVTHVVRGANGVTIKTMHEIYFVDQVIMATHADDSLKMLEDATEAETKILGAFRFSSNDAYVHTDTKLMPPLKKIWSAWNYIRDKDAPKNAVFVSYWMNALQPFLPKSRDIFVSLNPARAPDPECFIRHNRFYHPCFDKKTLAAQKTLHTIQGVNRTWFCGAWTGYGFHEDGVSSGIAVANALGVNTPWKPVTRHISPARLHTIGRNT